MDSRDPATAADPNSWRVLISDDSSFARMDPASEGFFAEPGLAVSVARFRAAVQAVSGILWTNCADGQMRGEQPGWAGLTGQSFEDYQGYGWASAVHPEDAQPTVDAWNAAVAARRTFVFEHRVRRHDGLWRDFAIRAVPVLREDGTIREWVGVHTDVTEQRKAEAVLARSRAELEIVVAARTRDLAVTQERLAHAQRMEALGQLAGGIAHDFNNVLQAVQGSASLIARSPGLPDKVHRLVRLISHASERGASITRRLLTFARRGELKAEAVDPAVLLASMHEVFAHTLGAGIVVQVDGSGSLKPLQADRSQLETVMVNLATNARDAMAGSGTLTLSAAHEMLHAPGAPGPPDTLKPGGYIRLSVRDTGAGMSPEVLARVSEPFFTTKEPGKGTGLGLAMARGFAEQSGGAMRIESAPGQGTTVSLWFPVSGPGAAAPVAAFGAASADCRAHLMLVDDEPIIREVLAAHLELEGYAVSAMADGRSALDLIEAGDPLALMISDLSMPGMDGVTLIRQAQQRRPGLPAILLTGFATDEVEEAARAGGTDFLLLRKPIDGPKLVAAVGRLLDGSSGSKAANTARTQ